MVCQLSARDINSLINRFRPKLKSYGKKENIRVGKKYEDKLCLVLEGMVYLCVENDDCERSILGYFKRGDFISHGMLLPEEQGVSYFIAKKAATVAYFDKAELIKYMTSDDEHIARLFDGIISQLARPPLSHGFILQQKTIRGKLTYYFKAERQKQQDEVIKIPLPYSDLAEYLGVDRSAMMKELTKMKNEGLISGEKHELRLNFG